MLPRMDVILRLIVFIAGFLIVLVSLISAIRTFVLPRSARDPLTALFFNTSRRIFNKFARKRETYAERDRIMAFYAPVTLVAIPVGLLGIVTIGYMLMFWAVGQMSWYEAFKVSGSSLLTLGYAQFDDFPSKLLEFSEAAFGLILIALLIAYLPTMYSAFSRRESMVTMLEVRAGSPPSAQTMLERFHRISGLDALTGEWAKWEEWFSDVEESHTSLAALVFFRSPQPERSWVTSAGTILDAAALTWSCIDLPRDAQAALCIRAGFIALQRICDFFDISYNPNPQPGDPISITRGEFDDVFDALTEAGLPLVEDREQAWLDYSGWRVNYDIPLLSIAMLTMAPYAPWVSDRFLRPGLVQPFLRRISNGLPEIPRK
jgi:hypothetical protein